MSYFVTSQTPIGTVQNDNTKQIVKYHFEVDTLQDLPTKNQFESSGIIIAMTSTAHVIQTNNNYEMDSSGTWIRQNSNSNIILDAGNLIPDNADLNNYTQGGKYYGGNSAGNSVSNLPVANSAFNFSLEVKNASPVHTVQYLTILRTADDPYIYKRRYYNGAWGSWYRFTGEAVATVQSASASLMQSGMIDAELTDDVKDDENEER